MALLAAFGASHWLSMKRFIWSVPRDIQPLFQGPQHHIRHISSSVISVPAEDGRPASTFIAKLKPHEILPDVISLSLRVQNIYSPHIAIFSARFRQACRETEVTETRFAGKLMYYRLTFICLCMYELTNERINEPINESINQ